MYKVKEIIITALAIDFRVGIWHALLYHQMSAAIGARAGSGAHSWAYIGYVGSERRRLHCQEPVLVSGTIPHSATSFVLRTTGVGKPRLAKLFLAEAWESRAKGRAVAPEFANVNRGPWSD